MWCSTCQHDVSAPASDEAQAACCSACGNVLCRQDAPEETVIRLPAPAPKLPDEDWQLEADLRSVQRLLASLRTTRIDPPAALDAPHLPAIDSRLLADAIQAPSAAGSSQASWAAWTAVLLGVAALACGAVLLGLSVAQEREDLWSLGLPLALGGQAALIVGLVLQLEGLWQTSRQTARSVSVLDDELARLRQMALPAAPPGIRSGV
jgi:hypothetical protein